MAGKFKTTFWLAAVLVISFCALIIEAQTISPTVSTQNFKNLAGSADEISSMRLPSPGALGTRSKSVMIPILAEENKQEFEIPIDSPENFNLMVLSPLGKNLGLSVAFAGEDFFDPRLESFSKNIKHSETTYGLDGNQFPAEVFSFESTKTGSIRVRLDFADQSLVQAEIIGYLVASSETPYRLYSYIDTHQTVVGRRIGFVSSLYNQKENGPEGQPKALFGNIRETFLLMRTPSGQSFRLEMSDRGSGEFETDFVPRQAGRYLGQIFSKGTTPDGFEFYRSTEHTIEVAPAPLELKTSVKSVLLDDLRWRLNIPVAGLKENEKIIAHAEIWALDVDNNEIPVAWIGGMSLAHRSGRREISIPLTLDSRWLTPISSAKSFELRNIRLQNPETSVVVGQSDIIRLPGIYATDAAKSLTGTITDDMRQGVRPPKESTEAVGGKLMLVHGYCSGDAWGAAASAGHFTNYVKFLDLNRNRSHDQFANLIRNFGSTLPSFGIVAHSQGGAASLHLYTYYWSGLDYATGTRLIQSVGTPYQGTALAGNLALLGQIFGAGCGSNYDLTYSGAAAWLANIPSWARAKVYYHTTSFTDVWWRYDYCNIATDPFLSDPDDGVVERSYAQLSGGINLGHKTGWCHTGGMRDPAQTNDASRNTNMNAYAAR